MGEDKRGGNSVFGSIDLGINKEDYTAENIVESNDSFSDTMQVNHSMANVEEKETIKVKGGEAILGANEVFAPIVNSNSHKKEDDIGKDLGSILVKKAIISDDQLRVAEKEMSNRGTTSLGDILISMGFVTETTLGEVLTNLSGVKKFDLKQIVLDSRLIKKIPKEVSLRSKIIPVSINKRSVLVATADVYDVIAIDSVRKYFPPHISIEPVYANESDVLEAIDQYYDYEMSVDGILQEIEQAVDRVEGGGDNGDYRNPIVRLVDAILIDAVHLNASDIHFEPEQGFLRLRYRIDGKMRQIRAFHIDYWPPVVVRLKIMASMNIAESRKPQDGHATSNVLGREVDFRVATQPTINGENVVMRILDKTKSLVPLDQLGYNQRNIEILKKVLKKPEGVIIVTGPTGSGKTTTLYSILSYINSVDKNVMTLEDPVEYEIPLIRQSSVREGSMSFVDGIKSLLRQDPDIIFIGEIRDADTASIAIRSAMTGHQVFSTLHTNDAVSVISRLTDIGVSPYLLSGSLVSCVAQRLIRMLCSNCKKSRNATDIESAILGVDVSEEVKIYDAVGCERCGNIGYKGRKAVSEIMVISKEISEMIALGKTINSIIDQAKKEGFFSMVDDGISKVLEGETSLEELIRSLDMTDRL